MHARTHIYTRAPARSQERKAAQRQASWAAKPPDADALDVGEGDPVEDRDPEGLHRLVREALREPVGLAPEESVPAAVADAEGDPVAEPVVEARGVWDPVPVADRVPPPDRVGERCSRRA